MCPLCGSTSSLAFWEMGGLPVKCNVLCATRSEALGVPRADIHLSVCRSCAFIWNTFFDPDRMDYDPTYENALHFSPRFRTYAEALARGLVEDYDLHGKDVLEIACGDGYFLRLLCAYGSNRGVGFDPSYTERPTSGDGLDVSIVPDYYGETYADRAADFICCRHALEHIPDPVAFLRTVRRTIGERRDTVVFFEVPHAMFILRDLSVWDIIYEHCGYFTARSLTVCFEAAGFRVETVREEYDGQFLTLVARPAEEEVESVVAGDCAAGEVVDAATAFTERFSHKLDSWAKQLADLDASGRRAVLWGAGSKGITILNMLSSECVTESVAYVVDINERKHGKFVSGTGQKIVSPEFLKTCRPDVVIVMNPVYEGEIRRQLTALDLSVDLLMA